MLGLGGAKNKGNLALLYSITTTLKSYIPDAEFILSTNISMKEYSGGLPEDKRIGVFKLRDLKSTLHSVYLLAVCTMISFLEKRNKKFLITPHSELYNLYTSDLVIYSGGDTLSGEGGSLIPEGFINISYALLLNKPVVIYGESIGFYENSITNSIAKKIFNKVKLILVREDLSAKYICDNKINGPDIHVTADSAFILESAPNQRVNEILSFEKIEKLNHPLIGINLSGLISKYRDDSNINSEKEIENIYIKTIDYLVETLGANIILIPHVYTRGSDDRVPIENVFKNNKYKSSVNVIRGEYSPQELKGIIGLCDLFIGARMHTTIASTSMIIPTIGIAYSHKMHGIIGKMLKQENYVIDIKDLSYEVMISKIDQAWKNKEYIKNDLLIIIPTLKEKALTNGEFVMKLLESFKGI